MFNLKTITRIMLDIRARLFRRQASVLVAKRLAAKKAAVTSFMPTTMAKAMNPAIFMFSIFTEKT